MVNTDDTGKLVIKNAIDGQGNYETSTPLEADKWYTIEITQLKINDEVHQIYQKSSLVDLVGSVTGYS